MAFSQLVSRTGRRCTSQMALGGRSCCSSSSSSSTAASAAAKPSGLQRQLLGGAGAASAGAALLWISTPARADGAAVSTAPPFTMDKPKFDQSTFYGRLMGMYDYIDPRTLLLTSEDLKKSQALLEEFKKTGKKPEGLTDEEMWTARKNVEVSLHPVTGEELFRPGRMSAFVPMNVPLCALMLMANGTKQVVFTQWLNQTYNSINNYVNRSGASVDWSALLQSYGLAVTSACGISLAASSIIGAIPALQVLGPFVPYLAVVAAGSANISFTRMEEWNGTGVSIVDETGKELGMSQKAGQLGVAQTVLSRAVFLPIAPMVMPILFMKVLKPLMINKPVEMVTELCLITVCISGMLPVALSILPQKMEIDVSKLEPEFQGLKDASGNPVTKVFANKGL
eukprot:CAMPEP_0206471500 /NCGR_PEP_ID=MMETSP0324_2-20121206/31603_1 /ASSEMBLY_ACC=CAM_ASM_000836 /TAXON_ID=2866 /ORGANISM="Crypthecodinium cohnii, Strain Seligo" /LENGTH=395 /DNA_ID=CAMNT_0053945843 /DNA_START=78 /DNA_END=1265 /DNA_ORIENTATION=-